MAKPWKVAGRVMADYFGAKSELWVAFEASRMLRAIVVGRDNRWVCNEWDTEAGRVLQRAFFDVDDLVENHLGIRVDFESLEYLDEGVGSPVYGCAYPKDRQMIICTRTLAYPPLYRATVIHEIGHILLHGQSANRCLLYAPDLPRSTPEEREANQFMHVALLPTSVLHLGIAYICHVWGMDLRLPIASANIARGRYLWKKRLFAPLIRTLGVSREMIAIKMAQQGFFSQDTLAYHKTYALASPWRQPTPATLSPAQLPVS